MQPESPFVSQDASDSLSEHLKLTNFSGGGGHAPQTPLMAVGYAHSYAIKSYITLVPHMNKIPGYTTVCCS